MPHSFIYFFLFVFGTIIGSFSNVCIYRIPLKQSVITPSSFCPSCMSPIKFYHNIPILSYIYLKGSCPSCHTRIPFRYPLVELLTGLIYIALYMKFGLSLGFFVFILLCTALVIIAFIDLENRIIPDKITLPGIVVGLLLSFFTISFVNSLLGLFVGGGIFFLIAFIKRGGMGGGDIKLMAMIGSFLGWQGSLMTILIGSIAGSIIGIILLLKKRKGIKDIIPFGPFLAFGGISYILLGEEFFKWYFYLVGL